MKFDKRAVRIVQNTLISKLDECNLARVKALEDDGSDSYIEILEDMQTLYCLFSRCLSVVGEEINADLIQKTRSMEEYRDELRNIRRERKNKCKMD